MAEKKKGFWETVPGVITGIAAIVTGLAALIPLLLNVTSHKHAGPRPAATQSASPGASAGSSSGSGGSPFATPTDLGVGGSTESPGAGGSTSGPLAASPSKADWGRVGTNSSPQQRTVTFTNQGPDPITLDGVTISGAQASAFGITGTGCGQGTTLDPGGNCTVTITYTPALGTQTATLSVSYHPPQGSSVKVTLTANGVLL